MREFRDRVAVITGGASGLGLAMARRFAREGMRLVLGDVQADALAQAVAAFEQAGVPVAGVRCDVSRQADVDALRDAAVARFGAVHVLCNNAGVAPGGLVWENSLEDWQWCLGVNVYGVIHGLRSFVPLMLQQQEPAHIVNTASIAGLVSTPGLGVYNVTKHGVVTLSETLYLELQAAGSQIGVSVLCPAWVKTRIGESERNRPGEKGQFAPSRLGRGGMANAIANGLAPADVAMQVLDAVRAQRFYVLTHPDFLPLVEQRHEDIHQGRNPTGAGLA